MTEYGTWSPYVGTEAIFLAITLLCLRSMGVLWFLVSQRIVIDRSQRDFKNPGFLYGNHPLPGNGQTSMSSVSLCSMGAERATKVGIRWVVRSRVGLRSLVVLFLSLRSCNPPRHQRQLRRGLEYCIAERKLCLLLRFR